MREFPVNDKTRETTRSAASGRRMTKPPKRKLSTEPKESTSPRTNITDRGVTTSKQPTSRGSVALSTGLLSNVPYIYSTASKVFGVGSNHPFKNYWTFEGGLPELICCFPTEKAQIDMQISQYFECVDPIYPMIHRMTFYADYEHFWALPMGAKKSADAAFVALLFVMMALGTQFRTDITATDRKNSAEFYASASNQSLRVSGYLSSASIHSIETMVLLTYFLINDNHASDGWSFSGVLVRQAYAMGLHRDPNIGKPSMRNGREACDLTLSSYA